MTAKELQNRIRMVLSFFIIALVVSGLTAIPLQWELRLISRLISTSTLPSVMPNLAIWIEQIYVGLEETFTQYPFIAYGTDWLAFGHIAIAIAFIGAFINPQKNLWVIDFGMIACVLVVPWALVFGALRSIPFFWRLIDCSFGVFGFIPLWTCRSWVLRLRVIAPADPRL